MEHLVVDSNLNGLAVQLRQELAAQNNRLAKRIDELSVEAHALQSQVDGLSQYVDEIQKVVVRLLSDKQRLTRAGGPLESQKKRALQRTSTETSIRAAGQSRWSNIGMIIT